MLILKNTQDFYTTVEKALSEIDENWKNYKGLVVCGSHNPTNTELIIEHIKTARENKIPALLICMGHQLGAIEYARNVLGIKNATSEEFGNGTFVVKKRSELKVGLHGDESWWSNYKVAIDYKIPEHFISVPFHPEYQSSKDKPHPLLKSFIDNCKNYELLL